MGLSHLDMSIFIQVYQKRALRHGSPGNASASLQYLNKVAGKRGFWASLLKLLPLQLDLEQSEENGRMAFDNIINTFYPQLHPLLYYLKS